MRHVKQLFAAATIAALLVLVPSTAWAFSTDLAGNVLASGETTSSSELSDVQRDLYWAGRSFDTSGISVGGDIIAAGQNIVIGNCSVGGSIRTASQAVRIADTSIENNITAAGQTITVSAGTTCAGAYLAGADIVFAGDASTLDASGQRVTLSGHIDGDATVNAQNVTVTDDAVITGTLTVHASSEPEVASGATVGNLDFQKTVDENELESAEKSASIVGAVGGGFYLVIVFCLIAIMLSWLLPRAVEGSSTMVRKRTAPMLLTGFVGMIAAIPALIILLIVAPLSAALGLALGAVYFVAAPFAGASIARLAFPRWNRIGSAALGGAVFGLACAIPILQVIVVIGSFIYLLGYLLQCLYLGMQRTPGSKTLADEATTLPPVSSKEAPISPDQPGQQQ